MVALEFLMMTYRLGLAALGSFFALAYTSAFASGLGGESYAVPSAPFDLPDDSYARGKAQFKKYIACKKCEFPRGVPDNLTARDVAKRVKAGAFPFNDTQRQDVMIYLEKRYGAAIR
jgi:hypothetical protein